jgi:hypothetical protein
MAPSTTKTAAAAKPKATANGGVKKTPGRKGKNNNAKNAMAKMQSYFKEHRAEFSSLPFKEQQKELGKKWKAAPENPKNAAA